MKKNTFLSIGLFCICLSFNAQSTTKTAIQNFQETTQATISFNKNLTTPGFVKFPITKPFITSGFTIEKKVNSFLSEYKAMYAIENTTESLQNGTLTTDTYGLQHYTLKQYHKGIPVFDAQLKFHFDRENNLKAINGTIIPDIKLQAVPTYTKTEAGNLALRLIENQNLNQSGKELKIISNQLYIFPKGLAQGKVTSKHLVYQIEVRNDIDVREFVFIDALTGKLVEQFTGIAHALNRSLYEVDLDNLRYAEGGSTFFLNQWQKNEVATAGHVYYFFKNAFGHISYDNADAEMVTINNNPDIECPNATWNGTTTNYCNGTASDDVVAHEWGHAYTQYTSNLIYSYESGALNEAFSDIWGETVDLMNNYEDEGENMSVRTGNVVTDRWKMRKLSVEQSVICGILY